MGFNIVKREYNEKARLGKDTLAIEVSGFKQKNGRTYVLGRALPDSEQDLMVTVADWWSKDFKDAFDRLPYSINPGGVMVFANCTRVSNGEYQAGSYRTISKNSSENYFLINNEFVRIGPMITKKGSSDRVQTIQWVEAKNSVAERTESDVLGRVEDLLGKKKIGHPGAVVRGVDDQGLAMSVLIRRPWDIKMGDYCSPSEAIDRFRRSQEINVSGIGIRTSAEEFLGFISRFPDATWEVMPMHSLTRKTNHDLSNDYRFHPSRTSTGFMRSLVAGTLDDNSRYNVSAIYPIKGAPIPLAYVPGISEPEFKPTGVQSEPEPTVVPVSTPKGKSSTGGLKKLIARAETPLKENPVETNPNQDVKEADPNDNLTKPKAKAEAKAESGAETTPNKQQDNSPSTPSEYNPGHKPLSEAESDPFAAFADDINIDDLGADDSSDLAPSTSDSSRQAKATNSAAPGRSKTKKTSAPDVKPDAVESSTAIDDDDVDDNTAAFGEVDDESELTPTTLKNLGESTPKSIDNESDGFTTDELDELSGSQSMILGHLR